MALFNQDSPGILGRASQWMTPDRASAFQALGMGLSQLGAGQPVNLSPAYEALQQRQMRSQQQQMLDQSGVMQRFTPDQRAILAQMEPSAAQRIIAEALFAPEPTGPAPIEINGQLVDPTTMRVLGDYRDPQAPQQRVSLVGPGDPSRATWGLPDDGKTYQIEHDDTGQFLGAKPLGGASVEVNNLIGGEDRFDSKAAEWMANFMGQMADGGAQAQADLGQIGVMERLLESGEIGGTTDAWKSWAQQNLGVSVSGGNVEALNAVIARLVPQQRPPGSGEMSNADLALFQQSLPQLINSPEGNRLILDVMRGLTEYRRKQGEIAAMVMLGEIDRREGLEMMYALEDPLANVAARIQATAGDGEAPMRREDALNLLLGD